MYELNLYQKFSKDIFTGVRLPGLLGAHLVNASSVLSSYKKAFPVTTPPGLHKPIQKSDFFFLKRAVK
jgi:hypothetical protein